MTFGSLITLTDLESFNLRHKYAFFGTNKNFYTFVNKNPNAKWTFKAEDFNLLDDDIKITTSVAPTCKAYLISIVILITLQL